MTNISSVTLLRLCLSGSLLALAITHILAPHVGFATNTTSDIASAVAGAGIVLALRPLKVI